MKLNYKRTFLVGFAFMAICAFWQMYDNIIPLILQHTFGLKDGIIGVIMAADNVLAVFLLPVVALFRTGWIHALESGHHSLWAARRQRWPS